jgi:hypothetical protein
MCFSTPRARSEHHRARRKGAPRSLPALTAPDRSRRACGFFRCSTSRRAHPMPQARAAPARGLRLPGKPPPSGLLGTNHTDSTEMPKRRRDSTYSSSSLRPASESSCKSRRQGSSCSAEISQAKSSKPLISAISTYHRCLPSADCPFFVWRAQSRSSSVVSDYPQGRRSLQKAFEPAVYCGHARCSLLASRTAVR